MSFNNQEVRNEFIELMKRIKSEGISIEDFEKELEGNLEENFENLRIFLFQQTFKKYFCSVSQCEFINQNCTEFQFKKCSYQEKYTELFFQKILSHSAPSEVQKLFPRYNPNNLLILAWSGTLSGNRKDNKLLQLKNLVWMNEVLRDSLKEHKTDIISNRIFDNKGGISIHEFWNKHLIFNENLESTNIVKSFLNTVEDLANFLCGKKVIEINDELKDIFLNEESKDYRKQFVPVIKRFEIKLNNKAEINNESENLIIAGLSYSSIEGIELFDKNHYDLFIVFIIDPIQGNITKITCDKFLSVQGLITPAERRSKIAVEIKEEHAKGKALGLIARSYSHNIGSHSLLHIINELENENYKIQPTELAIMLNFSKTRNNLIADIASGISIYSLGMTLDKIFNPLRDNKLLKKYLCLTEKIRITTFPIIDSKKATNFICDMPFAATGCHAIYSLIENFARNSAKHNKGKNRDTISIKLNQEIKNDDFYKLTIYDSKCVEENKNILNSLIIKLNERLEKAKYYFQWGENINLNDSLGQAEMLAWCAFLRFIPFHRIPYEFSNNFKLAEYTEVNINGEIFLGFSFYLYKNIEVQKINNENIDLSKIKSNYVYYQDINKRKQFILKGNYLIKSKESNTIISPYNGIDLDFSSIEKEDDVVQNLLRLLMNFSLPNKKIRFYILDTNLFDTLSKKDIAITLDGKLNFKLTDLNITFSIVPEDSNLNSLDHSDIDAIGIWKRHGILNFKEIEKSKIASKLFHHENYGSDSNNSVHTQIDKLFNFNITYNEEVKPVLIEKLDNEFKNIFVMLAESALTRILIIDDRDLMGHERFNKLLALSGIAVYKVGDLDKNSEQSWEQLSVKEELLVKRFPDLAPFQLQKQIPFAIKSLHLSLNARFNKVNRERDWISFYNELNNSTPFFVFHTGKGNKTDDNIGCVNLSDIEQFTRNGLDKIALMKLIRNISIKTYKS